MAYGYEDLSRAQEDVIQSYEGAWKYFDKKTWVLDI